MIGYRSQEKIILSMLEGAGGKFIPMPHLSAISGSLNISKRISNLRKLGHHIENKLKPDEDGGYAKHSFYRLVKLNPIKS